MKIKLDKKEKLSVVTRDSDLDSVSTFISKDEISTASVWTEYLQIGVSRLHKVFVLDCDGETRVFVFENGQKVTRGYFKHSEKGTLVYTNSKLYEND